MSKLITRACVLVSLLLLSPQAGHAVVIPGDPVHAIAKDKAAGQAGYAQTDIYVAVNESVSFSAADSYDKDTVNDPEVADDVTAKAWQYSSDDGATWTGFGAGDTITKAWAAPGKYIVRAAVDDLPLPNCADDVGPMTDPAGAFESNHLTVYVVQVKLKDGETDVTNQTRNWVVGKPASLTAEVLPDNLRGVTYLWSIPEKKLKEYSVSDDAASEVPLSSNELTQKGTISFHWVDGAEGRQVTFTVTAPAPSSRAFTATTTFNVKAPTNVTMTAVTGEINVYSAGPAGVLIYEGEGMEFTGSYMEPTGFAGMLKWIQVITGGRRRCYNGTTHQWKYNEMYGCDLGTDGKGHYIYAEGNSAVDSPQQKLGLPYTKFQVVDQTFTMWLMYQPSGGVLVPLMKMDWWWSGAANFDGNEWVKSSGNHVQNPASSATTDYPCWSTNSVKTNVWIPE